MATEFRTSVVLDAKKATAQAVAFGKAVSKSSNILDEFQKKTLAVTQGGAKNVFRAYENSVGKLNLSMRKAVAGVHSMKKGMTDNERALSKLMSSTKKLTAAELRRVGTLERAIHLERQALPLMVALNRKYDENARVVAKAKKIRNELNLVVASGLKTRKEALEIFKREASALRKSTKAYKDKAKAEKAATALKRKELSQLDNLLMKHDREYAAKQKLRRVTSELNQLVRGGTITQSRSNRLLEEHIRKTKEATLAQTRRNNSVGYFQRVARNFSIATRIMLGGYAAIAGIKGWINLNKTAEAITLLDQKISLLTGDSGAFAKMSESADRIGLKIQDMGKIITRFAVVTNKAFNIETMSLWAETLTKSARATGTSTQEMTGALIQITQAMSAGRLMGDEYRSVTENLPLFTIALRKVFAGTTLSLKELSSQGLITNDSLIEGFGHLKEMVKGIPGITGTIEAQINSLSNAWQAFINKIMDTSYVKHTLDAFTLFIKDMTGLMDTKENDRIKEKTEEVEGYVKAIEKYDKLQKSNPFGFVSLFNVKGGRRPTVLDEDSIEGYRAFTERHQAELARLIKDGGKLIDEIENENLNKAAAAEHQRDLLRQKEEKRIKEYFDIMGGKDVAALREIKDLKVQAFTKQYKLNEPFDGEMTKEMMQGHEIVIQLEQDFQDDVLRIKTKAVNEQVKIFKRTHEVNREALLDEKFYSGSVVAINKALAKDLKAIEKEIFAGKEEIKEGLAVGTVGGIEEAKGLADQARLMAKAEAAVALSIQKTEASIARLTSGGKENSAYEKYLIAVNAQNVKHAAGMVEIKELYSGVGEAVGRLGKTLKETEQDQRDFNKQQLAAIKDEHGKKFEAAFSKRSAALRAYTDEMRDLKEAQKLLNLTAEEVAYHQNRISVAFLNATEDANALTGSYGFLQGAFLGVVRGFREFADKAESSYGIMAKHSNDFFEEASGAFGKFFTEGKSAFDELADSAKRMVDDIIADLLRLAAKKFIIQIAGTTAGLLGGSSSSFASSLGFGGSGSDNSSTINLLQTGYKALTTDYSAFLSGASLDASIDSLANMMFNAGFDGAGNAIMDTGIGLQNAGGGNTLVGGIGVAASGYAGGVLGNFAGEAIFGKEANSGYGKAVGSAIGYYVGTYIFPAFGTYIGTALGGFVGGLVDVVFGGDGKKRFALGVRTGADAPNTGVGQRAGASGLIYTGYTKRAGDEGQDAARKMVRSFADLDNSLTGLYGFLGTSIDLTGQSLVGKAHQAGKKGGDFFGSAEFNFIDGQAILESADLFLDAWLDAVEAQTGVRLDLEPLKNLRLAGESLAAAITRVQVEFVAVRGAAEVLGVGFTDLSIQGLVAADNIVRLVGGIDALSSSVEFYYENFYTEQEKAQKFVDENAHLLTQFYETFGVTIAKRSDLKDFVNSLDLATTVGQEAFATALKFAPFFVEFEKAMAVLDDTVGSVAAITDELSEAFKREISAKQDYIDKFIAMGDELSAASRNLLLSELSPLTNEERLATARQNFNSTLALASSGDEDAMRALASAGETLLQESRLFNASGSVYTDDFNMVRDALDATSDLAFNLASFEEQMLETTMDQYNAFLTANDLLSDIKEILTLQEAIDQFQLAGGDIGQFADGGFHKGGYRIVGERGPELEFTRPSYIMNSSDSSKFLGGGDSRQVENILRQLLDALKDNTDVISVSSDSIAVEIKKTSKDARNENWRKVTLSNVSNKRGHIKRDEIR